MAVFAVIKGYSYHSPFFHFGLSKFSKKSEEIPTLQRKTLQETTIYSNKIYLADIDGHYQIFSYIFIIYFFTVSVVIL